MSRQFTVAQRNGAGKDVVTTKVDHPEDALTLFRRAMLDAGHSSGTVERRLKTWTCTLMAGGLGYEVVNPDLTGSISIRITA